jgi:hypothetical protein
MAGESFPAAMTMRFEHCDTVGIFCYPRFFLVLVGWGHLQAVILQSGENAV